MKMDVIAPWTNGEEKTYEGMLGFIQQTKEQLLFYKKQGNNSEHINKDIEGYDAILNSGKEENVDSFMELKTAIKIGKSDLKLKNNMEIVEHLKKIGKWI